MEKKLHRPRLYNHIAGALLAFSSLECIAIEGAYLNVNGKKIVVSNTYISLKIVEQVESLMAKNSSVDTIVLHNIGGGVVVAQEKFRLLVKKYYAEVVGSCLSACAMVALAARELKLLPQQSKSNPTVLLIHGTYDGAKKAWSPYGLKNIAFLRNRLKVISAKDIETALTFPGPNNVGLYIFRTPYEPLDNVSTVFICENFPSKCSPIVGISLSDLGIKTM